MADGKLAPGDRAPAFTLLDQHGEKLALTSLKGRKVMIYFYPKALTPGCTTQSCLLRDMSGEIGATAILGISPDQPERQQKFDDEHSLGFPLLSDPDHKVAEKYGVWGEKMNYGRTYMGIIRSAFLVSETGRISHAWYKISPKATPTKLQQALAV
jgi:peroxiredoxin Q/BCP